MSQSETSSPKYLWGDMVDDDDFEKEFEGIVNYSYIELILIGEKKRMRSTDLLAMKRSQIKRNLRPQKQIYYLTK